jgi:predicted nucleotidyltransferase component of viral defense system
MAASVRQKLLNLSKATGDPFDLILTRYALERFLYRLGASEYSDRFVLKGAMLLTMWTGGSYRATRDLDFLGYGNPSNEQLAELVKAISQSEVEPDGLVFDTDNIRVTDIREQEEYDGRRIQFLAYFSKARIPIQIDIGFGDAVTPEPSEITYPTLLESTPPKIMAYPRESVVSEKLQAMVALGMPNSRMKDFYDVWLMASIFSFKGITLVEAISSTFKRRSTEIPEGSPIALTDEFATDSEKMKQWRAFLNRIGIREIQAELPRVIDDLRRFLIPVLKAALDKSPFDQSWAPGGPWSKI